MRQMLQELFHVTIHPEWDGERETFTVYRGGEVLTAPSLAGLWSLLLEGEALPAYDMRIAA